jgi:hypothetical protein
MLRRLSLIWRTFTPVEEAVLAAVASALPEPSAEQLRAQIAHINRAQRILDWTDICFYAMRRGRVHWPEAVLFPNRGEFELAVAVYHVGGQRFRTQLRAVAGHVFGFVTRPSIKAACFGPVEDLSVARVGNPAHQAAGPPELQRFFPSSYLIYWQAARDAPAANGWSVLAPSEAYLVHLTTEDFVVLAERQGEEWLLVPARPDAGAIHHCALGQDPRPMATDFAGCLER